MSVWTNIWGPSGSLQPGDISDSGECGHHFYFIESDKDILVDNYQQYVIHDRDYLEIAGSIEVLTGGEVLVKGE